MVKKPLFLLLFFIVACEPVKTWTYAPNKASLPKAENNIVIIHFPLKDTRQRKDIPAAVNYIVEQNKPKIKDVSDGFIIEETYVGRRLNPLVDIAKSVSVELKNTGFFQDVRYMDKEPFPIKNAFLLEGELTRAETSHFQYFSKYNVIGWNLTMFGIPYRQTSGTVNITYLLRNSKSEILFEKTYTDITQEFNGLYYNPVTASFENSIKRIALSLADDLKNHFETFKNTRF